ncbi:hypothetical protein [Streptantibioticus ferralitis]|uniref:Uncharacterized protein n=1 Tax=Streptantibioticus ferralitis TaxID=236510 RepID=A0ABT5YX36_9ACTN|nr:hypothetical protein [Streptantibioticus ferralitis]MDF2256120.1 hypothetical protein [Streptantibioticus ferralitis]
MPDALELPDDLIALQCAADAALAALGGPDVGSPSNWSPRQRREWDERWEAYRRAAYALNEHPLMRRAAVERRHREMRNALRAAVRHR